MNKCKYDRPWVGQCKDETVEGEEFCQKHLGRKCGVCGEPATGGCDETSGPLVCGFRLCDKHKCPMDHRGIPSLNPSKMRKEQQK